jgi:hypothetical protein
MASTPIRFTFEGDTSDLEKALNQVGRQFDKTEKQATSLGSAAVKAGKAAKVGLTAVGVAAAAAAAAVLAATKATITFGLEADKIAKSAKAVGASAEDFQKIVGAFGLGGLTAEQTEMAVKKLGLRIGQVAAGAGGPAAEAFKKLGLSAAQLEALPLPERMALIADRVKDLGSQSQRAAVLNAIFEESGLAMAGAFAQGGDAIRDAAQQIEDAGIITNEVARQAEDMADAVALAQQSWVGIKTEALGPIIPLITEIGTAFADLSKDLRETGALEDLGKSFTNTFLEIIGPAVINGSAIAAKALAALPASFAAVELGMVRLQQAARAVWDIAQAGSVTGLITNAIRLINGQEIKIFSDETVGMTSEVAEATEKAAAAIRELGAQQEAIEGIQDAAQKALKKAAERMREQKEAAEQSVSANEDAADALGKTGDKAEESAEKVGQAILAIKSIEMTSTIARQAQEAADALQPVADKAIEIGAAISSMFGAIQSALTQSIREGQDELSRLQEEFENEANGRRKMEIQAEARALRERIEQEKEAARASFAIQKAVAISEAAIMGALAVLNALATGGAAAPALAVAAGIAAGANIAAIAAEPPPSFHSGGMVSAAAPDEITARLLRSEAVLSPQGVAAAGGEEGVRDLNRGGAGADRPIVSVLQVRSRTVDAMISDNLRTRQGPLTDALRAARPRALGRHNPFASS